MNTAVIPSALCEALKVQRCSDEDIPRVWTALASVGLTSPDDWTTDFIKEEDFKSAGLSLLLSRKLLAALRTAGASGAQEGDGFATRQGSACSFRVLRRVPGIAGIGSHTRRAGR